MQKFLVVFLAPAAGLHAWMQTDPEIREAEEAKLMDEWNRWTEEHEIARKAVTAGIGKTKRVTEDRVEDTQNDMMLFSIVEGESHEAVAAEFKDHPHFAIPDATIEIMPVSYLPESNEVG